MIAKGICPATGKEKEITVDVIHAGTIEEPDKVILGRMYCDMSSVYNCNECPIRDHLQKQSS